MTVTDQDWLAQAQELLVADLPVQRTIPLRYALGKYHDDIGAYDEAFAHYRMANNLKKRFSEAYDRANHEGLTDQLITAFSAERMRAVHAGALDATLPLLIVGMPRSGTSLTEQIVASHPAVFGAGELRFWTQQAIRCRDASLYGRLDAQVLQEVGERCLTVLSDLAPGAGYVADKMPNNFLRLGFFHAVFPNAKIIHVQRHPLDTCLSIYFQNFHTGHMYANDLDDLAHYYREYHRLMAHWRAVLPPEVLLDVPYEGLIEDQETWSRRIIDFLGLQWDARCLGFHKTERKIGTASNWQARQPIYTTSRERWCHYEDYVEPLLPLLELATSATISPSSPANH